MFTENVRNFTFVITHTIFVIYFQLKLIADVLINWRFYFLLNVDSFVNAPSCMANARRRKSEREAIRANVNLTAAVAIWRGAKVALRAATSGGSINISIVRCAAILT